MPTFTEAVAYGLVTIGAVWVVLALLDRERTESIQDMARITAGHLAVGIVVAAMVQAAVGA